MCSDINDENVKKIFEKEYGRVLSINEFFDIKRNLLGFFRLLIDMERKNNAKQNK